MFTARAITGFLRGSSTEQWSRLARRLPCVHQQMLAMIISAPTRIQLQLPCRRSGQKVLRRALYTDAFLGHAQNVKQYLSRSGIACRLQALEGPGSSSSTVSKCSLVARAFASLPDHTVRLHSSLEQDIVQFLGKLAIVFVRVLLVAFHTAFKVP